MTVDGPGRPVPPPAAPEGLLEAAQGWLEAMRLREPTTGWLGPDLALAALAQQLVDQDKIREGLLLQPGELFIERLDAHEGGLVDLEATLVLPPDLRVLSGRVPDDLSGRSLSRRNLSAGDLSGGDVDETADIEETVTDTRLSPELVLALGAGYWEPAGIDADPVARGWQLFDYVREGRRASATWCTHPVGQGVDAGAGIAAVPQAITVDGKLGRVFLEVSNERDDDIVLSIGRPPRPQGLFRRSPRVAYPDFAIPVPAHGTTHLVGRTNRPRLTEVEIFAWDPGTRQQVGALLVPAELLKHHPGGDGTWCSPPEEQGDDALPPG